MNNRIVPISECSGFFRAGQKIEIRETVELHKVSEAWVFNVVRAIAFNEQHRNVIQPFSRYFDRVLTVQKRSPCQHGKPELDVSHVPMGPFAGKVLRQIQIEIAEHFPLETVEIAFPIGFGDLAGLGDLMNGKGNCLAAAEISHGDSGHARRFSGRLVGKTFARIVDDSYVFPVREQFA